MNSNVYDGGTLDTSIYNYYFYAGFGSIYKIIFPITILLLVTAAVCVYKKVSMASRLSIAANISAFITGALLLFARITESSKGVHILINSFYMNKSDIGNIQTVQLMSRIPIAYILVMVLSVLGLLMVKSSTITKLKYIMIRWHIIMLLYIYSLHYQVFLYLKLLEILLFQEW